MASTPKNHDDEQTTAGVSEIENLVKAWVSSKEGAEQLTATQKSAKSAADFVDSEVEIDPDLLQQSVTL